MAQIELHRRTGPSMWTEVDDEDAEMLARWRWCPQRGRNTWYAITSARNPEGLPKRMMMHGLLLGVDRVDHIDGDGLNNHRSNLRPATAVQNLWNAGARRSVDGGSRFKGVRLVRQPWAAGIVVGGVLHSLGRFTSEEEAARAYDAAAREHFGEYARRNFPEEPPDATP
jgi:hypothetical protein